MTTKSATHDRSPDTHGRRRGSITGHTRPGNRSKRVAPKEREEGEVDATWPTPGATTNTEESVEVSRLRLNRRVGTEHREHQIMKTMKLTKTKTKKQNKKTDSSQEPGTYTDAAVGLAG